MSTQEFPTPERKLLAAATPVPPAMLRAGMVIRTPALTEPSLINRVMHGLDGAVAKVFVTRPDGAMVLLPSVRGSSPLPQIENCGWTTWL
jgi:hypothetical protein